VSWQLFIPIVLFAIVVVGIVALTAVREVPATRPWATVAVLAIASFPLAIVLHNVLSAFIDGEEAVSFVIALLVAPGFIAAGTLGVALTLSRDARFALVGRSMLLAGAGFAVFALYAVFALVVTAIAGGNPPFQSVIEQVALGLSAAAMALGAILAAVTRVQLPAAKTI
jgi:hypothetical protein